MTEPIEFEENGIKARYWKGWKPIPSSRWRVETIANGRIVYLGEITVRGSRVAREMDEHHSIHGHEPKDVAEIVAHERFPNANPIIVDVIPKKV
jgi:hypothetical protein